MKFYQTIVLVMLGIMYATTIFGAEEPTPPINICDLKVSPDICNLIDEFRGDGFFEKTGCPVNDYNYPEPHSRALDFIKDYSLLIYLVPSMAAIFPTLFKKFPKIEFTLKIVFASFLSAVSAIILTKLTSKILKNKTVSGFFPKKSFLQGIFPEEVDLSSYKDKELRIKSNKKILWRNMQPKNKISSDFIVPMLFLFDKDKGIIDIHHRLEKGKVGEKLGALTTTQEKITSCAFFNERNTIVTASERGIFRYDFQRNKRLHTIMNTD